MDNPIEPATGFGRHLPSTDTDGNPAAHLPNGAASGPAHAERPPGQRSGYVATGPGLDRAEMGLDDSSSDEEERAARNGPTGAGAGGPRSVTFAGVGGAEAAQQTDRRRSTVDRVGTKLRGEQDELRRDYESKKSKVKSKVFSKLGKGRVDTGDWMHGVLHVTVHEAAGLPGDPTKISVCPAIVNGCLIGCSTAVHGKKPPPHPYCVVQVGNLRKAYTRVYSPASDAPKWEEKFRILVAGRVQDIQFSVKEGDSFGSPHLGTAKIAGAEVANGKPIERRWLRLYHRTKRASNFGKARICVSVDFDAVGPEVGGKEAQAYSWENRHAYFQARRGNKVTLYADAVADPQWLPPIPLARGLQYRTPSAWDDMLNHIMGAKHFIYITGWSVWTQLMMKRDPNGPMVEDQAHPKLGNLLKRKAEEGVRVCVLQWDDRTSVTGPLGFVKTKGLLGTYDEDTKRYFAGSKVYCQLALRGSDQEKNIIKSNIGATNFTHHQKAVILDTPGSSEGGARRVTAYIGGIDLTSGRYDDARHELFSTVATTHSEDFYQNTMPADQACGGPRQPWHDVHSRLEGAIAFDVLTNFEQRWRRQATESIAALLDLRSVGGLTIPSSQEQPDEDAIRVAQPDSPEEWSVQLFRSIDSESCVGFPTDNLSAYERGLVSLAHGRVMDRSIQNAYIHAIRKAEKFIYIENQYFLGGSGEWQALEEADICNHLVPIEIALKIVEKMRRGEFFAAYITIPLFPEGIPESGTVQEVLHWQTLTIRMMYRIVGQACKETGRGHPRDYLNFFSPCKRETKRPNEPVPAKQPPPKSPQALAQKTRRGQIYVHAKTMMVDDEYVIVGSANINERSMSGARDTELAMGAHQPALGNRGHVYGFRMALWREQLGQLEPLFEHPGTLECVQRVRVLTQANWEAYIAPEVQDLPHGHLIPYPYEIAPDGLLSTKPGHRNFPDTKASVLGGTIKIPKFVRKAFGYLVTT